MHLRYNAPVILTFVFAATAVTFGDRLFGGTLTTAFFSAPPTLSLHPITVLRMGAHALGHARWDHLVGNATFLLLLGPIVEEKYGSSRLLAMIAVTAFATGMLNAMFFSTGVLGASGIVFLCIALASFTNMRSGELPLTFVIVALLYGGTEVLHAFRQDQVSQFAHLLGGACGAAFGFVLAPADRNDHPSTV